MRTRWTFLVLCFSLLFSSALANPDTQGFIYGTVTWPDGDQLTGFIRWEDEEAFWGDLFHCGYRHNPWSDHMDLEALRAQRRREYYENHGLLDRLIHSFEEDDEDPMGWRMFLIRIGDIKSIEINDGEDDFVVTADGSRHQIGGYGNDSGADLVVYSGAEEPTEIDWNDLKGIEFKPVPDHATPYAKRLYGIVESSEGTYEGFIQWDVTECLSIDTLDGRLNGKNRDFQMGEIRSIARSPKENNATIVLKDGSSVTMGGSNDVDRGNRGIMVENEEYGRVVVPWKRFEIVTFVDNKGSGPGRDTFQNGGPLTGILETKDGQSYSGRLVFDLDEGWKWDIFNGTFEDLEFNIPFSLIKQITIKDEVTCGVELRSGRNFDLTDTQDTGKKNGGVLVFEPGQEKPRHVVWAEIQSLRLDL